MNMLFEAAREVSEFLIAQKWRHCVIGGLALLRWGEPRTTLDVDLSLLTGFGREEFYARLLLEQFKGRMPNALEFAIAHRVLLLTAANGTGVDIAFAALPFEEQMMDRASAYEFAPGVKFITCTAEDLFIMKAFAARPRDWFDVEGIVARQSGKLDSRYILDHLKLLGELKEAPDIYLKAKAMLEAEE